LSTSNRVPAASATPLNAFEEKLHLLESRLSTIESSYNLLVSENTELKRTVANLQQELSQTKVQIEQKRSISSDNATSLSQQDINTNIVIRGVDVNERTPETELTAVYEDLRKHLGISDFPELSPTNSRSKNRFTKIIVRGKVEAMIKKLFDYNACDEHLPCAICSGCLRNLYRSGNRVDITLPDLSIFPVLPVTRSTKKTKCKCQICEMTRTNRLKDAGVTGRGITKDHYIKLCNLCYTQIHGKKGHSCNNVSRFSNLQSIVVTVPTKQKEQILSSVLKLDNTTKTCNSSMTLSQRTGKPLRVSINAENKQNPIISTKVMENIQTSLGLTQNKTVSLAALIRNGSSNRKIIEPGLKQKLSNRLHELDGFFGAELLTFQKIKADKIEEFSQYVVFCHDLEGLIRQVKMKRQVHHVHLKFGIDGGCGYLKVCLSMQSIDNDENGSSTDSVRQKYGESATSAIFQDSGVKKLFIIGVAPSVQENYSNVSLLWSKIHINEFLDTIATDLKLANILTGIMPHSSTYPCTYCVGQKGNLGERAALRTIGNIVMNHAKWKADGEIKSNAKKYANCIHEPIFSGESEKLILDIIPPPELHLMLGVVNTIFDHMLGNFADEAMAWAKSCNVERDVTHGSGFNGNSCKKLLDKLDILRSKCSIGCVKYVQVLDDFRLVVNQCFGKKLNPEYDKSIDKFKKSFMDLKVSVTPKIHAVFFHIKDFCSRHQNGLGFYSEQAMEAAHFEFKTIWMKYNAQYQQKEFVGQKAMIHDVEEEVSTKSRKEDLVEDDEFAFAENETPRREEIGSFLNTDVLRKIRDRHVNVMVHIFCKAISLKPMHQKMEASILQPADRDRAGTQSSADLMELTQKIKGFDGSCLSKYVVVFCYGLTPLYSAYAPTRKYG
ncbi:hypothetical protein Bhyg_12515, partial [Pseudolycoriella hygida]